MTRRELWQRIISVPLVVGLLGALTLYCLQSQSGPGGYLGVPKYRAVFGPGGGYFRSDGTRVTDPGEERQAAEQSRRILALPLEPGH